MKKPTISFFCPAYYDEKNLPILIPKVIKVLKKNASNFEVVIVEDGSPDKTGAVADQLAIKFKPYIRVIHHAKNMGYGTALRTGFNNANLYEYTFYTDGDNQFDVNELEKMISHLKNYDAVIGFRNRRALTTKRLIQTWLFNLIAKKFFNLKVRDINCSMKIISRKALNSIKLESKGAFIDAELLIKISDKKYKIKEVAVSHFPRNFGKASGGSVKVIYNTIAELLRFYFQTRVFSFLNKK